MILYPTSISFLLVLSPLSIPRPDILQLLQIAFSSHLSAGKQIFFSLEIKTREEQTETQESYKWKNDICTYIDYPLWLKLTKMLTKNIYLHDGWNLHFSKVAFVGMKAVIAQALPQWNTILAAVWKDNMTSFHICYCRVHLAGCGYLGTTGEEQSTPEVVWTGAGCIAHDTDQMGAGKEEPQEWKSTVMYLVKCLMCISHYQKKITLA